MKMKTALGIARNFLCLIMLLLLGMSAVRSSGAVVINEICAQNHNTRADENGDYEDWIELYNPTGQAVPLNGYRLSDDPTSTGKWVFPNVSIPQYGYLLIWASNKDRRNPVQPLHTNFRLEESGEYIGLYNPAGSLVDSVTFGEQRTDTSYGRKPDGSVTWVYFESPTPTQPNLTAGATGFVVNPIITPGAGVYAGQVVVSLSTPTPNAQIRYTLGGTDVTASSQLYSGPLTFTTHTVVRAQAFAPLYHSSRVVTKTFLINVNTNMPILSVVTDPLNLFGPEPRAIYYADKTGEAYERPASIEFWEAGAVPGFELTCGLRVRGGASQSRDDIHKKSLQINFRRERGPAKLEYPIIPSTPVDKFDKILLRAGYNDGWCHHNSQQRTAATYVRDQVTRDLRRELGEFAAQGSWCMLFLNGKQWGIYNITEGIEKQTIENYTDIADWDIISLDNDVEDGDMVEWSAFNTWVASHDLTNAQNYQTLQTMLDLKNFTDYMIINIWGNNSDWPHHNGYVGRPRVPGGKWIGIDWDVEYAYGGGPTGSNPSADMMSRATDQSRPISNLLHLLLLNSSYRTYFAQRFDILVNTIFEPAHMMSHVNALAAEIRPGIPFEGIMPGLYRDSSGRPIQYTQPTWEAALVTMGNWIGARTPYVRQHIRNRVPEITGWREVRIEAAQGGEGTVIIQGIRPSSYPWSGTFFTGIPVTLTAIPKPGYYFSGWSDRNLPSQLTVSATIQAGTGPYSVFARFGAETTPPSLRSVEFVARNQLVVDFSKPVQKASAENPANYTIDHEVGHPVSATLLTTTTVLLKTSANLEQGTIYNVSIVNVEAVVGSPIPASAPAVGSASFAIPSVVISELMYNTHGSDVEWVELRNTTPGPLNVSGWYLTDDSRYPAQAEGAWMLPGNTSIPANGRIVVGLDRDMDGWSFPPNVPFVQAIILQGGSLGNAGDNLALYSAASGGSLIDGSPTGVFPDLAVAGRSLEKTDDRFPWRSHPAAWKACGQPIGWATPMADYATPGRAPGQKFSAVRWWSLY